jgi:hypothetical protein
MAHRGTKVKSAYPVIMTWCSNGTPNAWRLQRVDVSQRTQSKVVTAGVHLSHERMVQGYEGFMQASYRTTGVATDAIKRDDIS